MATYQVRVNDTTTLPNASLINPDGTNANLSPGGTTVQLVVDRWDGVNVLTENATIVTPNPGTVTYTFDADDFGTGKLVLGETYRARWVVTFTGSPNIISTFPTEPDDFLISVY